MTDSLDQQKIQELRDLLYTIRNSTKIADILLNLGEYKLLPTILEFMFERTQSVIDDYCIDR